MKWAFSSFHLKLLDYISLSLFCLYTCEYHTVGDSNWMTRQFPPLWSESSCEITLPGTNQSSHVKCAWMCAISNCGTGPEVSHFWFREDFLYWPIAEQALKFPIFHFLKIFCIDQLLNRPWSFPSFISRRFFVLTHSFGPHITAAYEQYCNRFTNPTFLVMSG